MKARKTVKASALILALATGMTTLSGCAGQGTKASDVAVWSAVNTDVIMQDTKQGKGGNELTFNTFKGDVESAQIIFTPQEDVGSFDFVMGDVKNKDGDVLKADLFEVYAQRYIQVSVPTTKKCVAGFYPDALIPIEKYTFKRDDKVAAGSNQGIWVNLNVPADAKAGTYTGKAVLTVDEGTINVPVSVTIYDIDMPEEIHSTSSYYLDMQDFNAGETATDEMIKTYYDFFVAKRANFRGIPGHTGINKKEDVKVFAEDVVAYAKNPRVSAYALPYVGSDSVTVDGVRYGSIVSYDYCYEVLYAMAEKNVELLKAGDNVDLFKKAHYYLGSLIDEPTANKYEAVKACDLNIHKAKLAVAATGILNDYPEVKESLLSLRHVVTTAINELLYGTDTVGGVQTWCPTLDNFGSESARALARDRQNSTARTGGESVWWYSCINPKNPYSSYQLDEDLLVARMKGWMEYDYDIGGFLYWNVNYWRKHINSQTLGTDVWTDPLSWESANGDGRLVYPGKKYGVNGPISTIRLENIRESMEDYELLWRFEQTIAKINETNSKTYDSDKILGNFYDQLYEELFVKEGVTEKDFDNVRIELMQLLEQMLHNPTKAFAQLDKLN